MPAKDNRSIWICTLYFSSVTILVRAIKFRKCGITVPHLLLIRKYMQRISYTYTSEQAVLNEGFKIYILSLHTVLCFKFHVKPIVWSG